MRGPETKEEELIYEAAKQRLVDEGIATQENVDSGAVRPAFAPDPGSPEARFREQIDIIGAKFDMSYNEVTDMLWHSGILQGKGGPDAMDDFIALLLSGNRLAARITELWSESEKARKKYVRLRLKETHRLIRLAHPNYDNLESSKKADAIRDYYPATRPGNEWEHKPETQEIFEEIFLAYLRYAEPSDHAKRLSARWRREWARKQSQKPKPKKKVDSAPVVKAVVAQSANFPGDRDFYSGLTLRDHPGAWLENQNEGTRFYAGKSCTVTYQPDELFSEAWWIETREETLAALDRRFRSIRNDMTADVADILFHHWLANRKLNASGSAVEKVGISFSQICQYRGVQAKPKAIEMVYEALRDVRAFRLNDGKIDERLFDISTVEMQPSLWHGTEQPGKNTGLVYSPGFFLSKAVEGEWYTAFFACKVWELDPYRHPIAKRLARYLRGEWRMNTQTYLNHDGQNANRFRPMQAILSDAGIAFDGSEAQKDPKRFIKSIEDGINTLYDQSIIRDGCPYIYHPEDRAAREALPRKGILAQWLQLRARIDPPAEVRDELERFNAKRMVRNNQLRALPEPKKRGRKPRKK